MKRHGLRDGQFARIENLLPGRPGTAGRNSDRGQPAVCRSGDLEAPRWRAVARFTRALRWLDNTHKRFSRRPESGVWEESFQGPGGRSRQRIRDDRRHHRQSPLAQRRRA